MPAIELDDLVARSGCVRVRLSRAREELGQAEKQLAQNVELTAVVGRLTDFADQVRAGLDRIDW